MIALWLLDTNSVGAIPRALLDILSPEESERAALFQPAEQRRFLLSRIALRRALSAASGGDPRSWLFETSETGKISLQNGDIEFSLSHAKDLLGIAISTSGPVGFDLENAQTSGEFDFDEVFPKDLFSENEKSYLERQSKDERWSEMLKVWTRKEAYSKLLGLGLHLDFSKIDMIAWPPFEPEVEIETHEILINETEYFMSLASRTSSQKVANRIDIRSSNLFSCGNC
jgi:phosphopantetheinyl transferase